MKRSFSSNCIPEAATLLLIAPICFVCSATAVSSDTKPKDIVGTAVAAGDFDILVAAVEAAGLVDTLRGRGPFTVLAPNDRAFKRLPEETLQTLLKPENKERLQAILTYHVLPGQVSAREAYGLNNAGTVNGQRLDISRRNGKLVVGSASIIAADIHCSNGVIHVIDQV